MLIWRSRGKTTVIQVGLVVVVVAVVAVLVLVVAVRHQSFDVPVELRHFFRRDELLLELVQHRALNDRRLWVALQTRSKVIWLQFLHQRRIMM